MKLLVILSLLMIAPVLGLSASPAQYTTSIHSGTDTYTLRVINDEQHALAITLTPTGQLTDLISVEPNLTLAPGEEAKLKVMLQMPEQTQPGILDGGIIIESRPVAGATVAAAAAVLHAIRIITPKNGVFLDGELLNSEGILGEPLDLTVSLVNTGTEPIKQASAVVRVANKAFTTDTISLAPGETKNLVVEWTPKAIGIYKASAQVTYDGHKTLLTSGLAVGKLSVDILGIEFGDFKLGQLFKAAVLSQSDWADKLAVTANVVIVQNNKTVASSQSLGASLNPLQETSIPLFIDSKNMSLGAAELKVRLDYAGKTTNATFPLVVSANKIAVVKKSNYVIWLLVLVLVIVAAIVAVLLRRKYIKKDEINNFGGQ